VNRAGGVVGRRGKLIAFQTRSGKLIPFQKSGVDEEEEKEDFTEGHS
jgi:hypothetical protein